MPSESVLTFDIRIAEPRDAGALVELVNSVYRGETSRAGWTTEADLLDGQRTDLAALDEFLGRSRHDALMLVGEHADQLIACLQLERHGDDAHLGMLSVAARQQDRGIGRHMIAAAERYARDSWQARTVTLSVIHLRHELIGWYQRCGFTLTSERDEFPYGNPRFGLPKREDLWFVILRKDLSLS